MTTCFVDCDLEESLFSAEELTMPRKTGKCKDCVMCSPGSMERKVCSSGKTFLNMTQSDVGVNCGICNRFSCLTCLEKIVAVFPNDMKKRNHWYRYVAAFIAEQKMSVLLPQCYPAGPFVGHCCELRFFRRSADYIVEEKTQFDGCLFLPEYRVIINPCIGDKGIVDIHGFGGYNPHFAGVVHCVPSHTSCIDYHSEGVKATGSASSYQVLKNNPDLVQFLLPYETKKKKVLYCVEVSVPHVIFDSNICLYFQIMVELVIFKKVRQFDAHLMGTNDPTVAEMNESYCIDSPFTKHRVDVTIVVGDPSNGQAEHYPLLLLRFWNKAINTHKVDFRSFYDESKKLVPRHGVSVTRLGGSSGTLQNSSQKQLLKFLGRPGSFPRKASAVKFLNRGLYLQCLYVSPYSGDATHRTKYSPVHMGGAFKPTQRLVKQFPFLYDFAEAKVISALLLQNVNKTVAFNIHQASVTKELGAIWDCDHSSRKKMLRDFIDKNTHTLVGHPVGYHRDVFTERRQSLENKICFVVPRQLGMGRGGAGPNKYVVALLDW